MDVFSYSPCRPVLYRYLARYIALSVRVKYLKSTMTYGHVCPNVPIGWSPMYKLYLSNLTEKSKLVCGKGLQIDNVISVVCINDTKYNYILLAKAYLLCTHTFFIFFFLLNFYSREFYFWIPAIFLLLAARFLFWISGPHEE